ncbi:MAG: aminopeptidase P family protein [Bdellovibrionales bacterium]|nr:aminopeptidase P family protein [Bdellovibrionales bacterium]
MRKFEYDKEIFFDRQKALRGFVEDAAIVIPAHSEYIRNHDVQHSYRQDSNLFYLTGFEEPEAVLVLRPGKDPESVLFVRKKDMAKEIWDGFRFGPQLTEQQFPVDKAYLIDDFQDQAISLFEGVEAVYYSQFRDSWFDEEFKKLMLNVKTRRGRNGKGVLPVKDAYLLLGELRVRKSKFEIDQMQKAATASSMAFQEMMKQTRPGMNERELHGLFIHEVMKRGCGREGYGTIVAGGANACTLHYVFNDQPLNEGEMVLVDAGGEYQYYSADITRTWPISGKFSETQKRVYSKLLEAQKDLVAMVKPGLVIKAHMDEAISRLTDIMLDEKLLKGEKADIIEKQEYRKYFPHGLGHYLGLDVHDAGPYLKGGNSRELEAGMVVTVEPGIYVPHDDDSAPEELRGLGIRIEDDVVVTETGHHVLTYEAPKEVDELESIIGSA